MFSKLIKRFQENRTMSALNSLDDATLKDIGIHRSEIPSLARNLNK